MGARLLPRNLPELFSYSLVLEREATKRYAELERFLRGAGVARLADEFEKIGREEKEQYELIALGTAGRDLPELAGWELSWYFHGEGLHPQRQPRTTREALATALAADGPVGDQPRSGLGRRAERRRRAEQRPEVAGSRHQARPRQGVR